MSATMNVLVVLAILPLCVSAQHVHGGSSDGSGGVAMIPYLHFTPGDALFFKEWVPKSSGAVGGACVGLFMLAVLQRCVTGMRGVMDQHWRQRSDALVAARFVRIREPPASTDKVSEEGNCCTGTSEATTESVPAPAPPRPTLPPFIWSHELARGGMQILQSFFGYALMLAVMTFNAAYILSVLLGLGAGEVLFGRFAHGMAHA